MLFCINNIVFTLSLSWRVIVHCIGTSWEVWDSLSRACVILINLPRFVTKLKIHHLHSLITTLDDFNSVDPSSMQDTCHIWTQFDDLALHEFLYLGGWSVHLVFRGVMDSIPVWDSDFFLVCMLLSYWSIHLSHFVNKLTIRHLYSLIMILRSVRSSSNSNQESNNFNFS